MNVGKISRFRFVERSVIPSRTPIWVMNPITLLEIGGPGDRLVLELDVALDLESPAMQLSPSAAWIAEALEGDRQLGRPAILDNPARRLVQRVPRHVAALAPGGRQHGVALYAIGVHGERVCALQVQEWINVQSDLVIGLDLIAVDATRTNLSRVGIVRMDPEIERVLCVGDEDLRLLRSERPLDRWKNSVTRDAVRQAGSSKRPSITGDSSTRTAVMVGRPPSSTRTCVSTA